MKALFFCFVCTAGVFRVEAQDDLLQQLDAGPSKVYSDHLFKGSRVVNGHSVETRGKGSMEFIFAHRFGKINDGVYELFGLDQAYVRYGLEYAFTDNLGIGVGRNSVDKTVDGFLKGRLLRQSKGSVTIPFTITAFVNGGFRTSPKKNDADYAIRTVDRLSYTSQLLIARKFSPALTIQVMPTMVHRNTVEQDVQENRLYALGIASRIKLSPSMSFNAEYFYRANANVNSPYKNCFGVGLDVETGGHVFQILLTSTRGLTERAFIAETEGNLLKGDLHLGFNVTRAFQVKK
jgi:hypothetical protein